MLQHNTEIYPNMVCVCVRACMWACVRACVCVYARAPMSVRACVGAHASAPVCVIVVYCLRMCMNNMTHDDLRAMLELLSVLDMPPPCWKSAWRVPIMPSLASGPWTIWAKLPSVQYCEGWIRVGLLRGYVGNSSWYMWHFLESPLLCLTNTHCMCLCVCVIWLRCLITCLSDCLLLGHIV